MFFFNRATTRIMGLGRRMKDKKCLYHRAGISRLQLISTLFQRPQYNCFHISEKGDSRFVGPLLTKFRFQRHADLTKRKCVLTVKGKGKSTGTVHPIRPRGGVEV
jgi:hypothetical protein